MNTLREPHQLVPVNLVLDEFLSAQDVAVGGIEDAKIDPDPVWYVIGLADRFKHLLRLPLPAFQHHRYGQIVFDRNVTGGHDQRLTVQFLRIRMPAKQIEGDPLVREHIFIALVGCQELVQLGYRARSVPGNDIHHR